MNADLLECVQRSFGMYMCTPSFSFLCLMNRFVVWCDKSRPITCREVVRVSVQSCVIARGHELSLQEVWATLYAISRSGSARSRVLPRDFLSATSERPLSPSLPTAFNSIGAMIFSAILLNTTQLCGRGCSVVGLSLVATRECFVFGDGMDVTKLRCLRL